MAYLFIHRHYSYIYMRFLYSCMIIYIDTCMADLSIGCWAYERTGTIHINETFLDDDYNIIKLYIFTHTYTHAHT